MEIQDQKITKIDEIREIIWKYDSMVNDWLNGVKASDAEKYNPYELADGLIYKAMSILDQLENQSRKNI